MIDNLPQYIERVEFEIAQRKSIGQTKFIQLSVRFESPNMVENFKRYFDKNGYKVWFKTCTRGYTDYEISWER